jgi:hypothetical protein
MVSIRRGANYTRELQAAIRTLKCPESSLVTAKEMWMGLTVEVAEARHFVSTPSRDRSRVVGNPSLTRLGQGSPSPGSNRPVCSK